MELNKNRAAASFESFGPFRQGGYPVPSHIQLFEIRKTGEAFGKFREQIPPHVQVRESFQVAERTRQRHEFVSSQMKAGKARKVPNRFGEHGQPITFELQ